MKEIEIYIELPARTCFAEVFFGGKVPERDQGQGARGLACGVRDVEASRQVRARTSPATRSRSPMSCFSYSVDVAVGVGTQLFGLDLLGEMPAAQTLLQRLGENPHAKSIAATRDAGMPGFIAAMRARFQGAG